MGSNIVAWATVAATSIYIGPLQNGNAAFVNKSHPTLSYIYHAGLQRLIKFLIRCYVYLRLRNFLINTSLKSVEYYSVTVTLCLTLLLRKLVFTQLFKVPTAEPRECTIHTQTVVFRINF
jgi:hypothetical protein